MAILIFEVEPSKYLKFYRSVTKKKLAILRTDYWLYSMTERPLTLAGSPIVFPIGLHLTVKTPHACVVTIVIAAKANISSWGILL